MQIEAQIALYAMTDEVSPFLTRALGKLDNLEESVRIEVDEISILMVGLPCGVFPALRDLYLAMAGSGIHSVLHALLHSRSLNGERLDPSDFDASETGEFAAARYALTVSGARHEPCALAGDAGTVFATLADRFCRLGPDRQPVSLDLTVAANSPDARRQ